MSAVKLDVPDDVLAAARQQAGRENQSLDELVTHAIAQHVAALRRFEYLRERGKKDGSRERFLTALNEAPNVPPIPGDELPGE